MLADLKPYPTYKDSGVPWLGTVPAHWDVRRPRALVATSVDRKIGRTRQLLTVSLGQRRNCSESSWQRATNDARERRPMSKYKLVWPGDTGYQQHAGVAGGLGVSRIHGIISPAYVRLSVCGRPTQILQYIPSLAAITRFI